jgi:hypothetical protein
LNYFLLVVALTSSEALAARNGPAKDAPELPQSAIPYVEQAALSANPEDSFRALVSADETAGINQIQALLGHTDFEEQWAFVPSIGLWIEVGRNESVTELDSEVQIDTDYLKEIVSLVIRLRSSISTRRASTGGSGSASPILLASRPQSSTATDCSRLALHCPVRTMSSRPSNYREYSQLRTNQPTSHMRW